jgi:RecA-family ATPase
MIQPTPLEDVLVKEAIPPNWLVKGIFPRGLLMVLAGDPGAGKTVLSYALSHALALGSPFLGHETTPTTVCYFDEENSEVDFHRYNQWIWHGLGCPPVLAYENRLNFYHFALTGPWFDAVLEVAQHRRPGLIVIDTATPVLNIQDENDNSEANRVIQKLRKIQKSVDSLMNILVLKHERQRDDTSHRRTIRGAKVWLGAVDRTFFHVIPNGCRKRKNGLRRTALVPDKLRSYGLEVPIGIEPSWLDESRKGLIFKAIFGDYRGLSDSENT